MLLRLSCACVCISGLFVLLSNTPLYGCTIVIYAFTSWWIFQFFPAFGNYKYICYELVFVCTHIFVSLGYISISRIAESYNKYTLNVTKQLLNCFLKSLKGKMSILLFQWQYIRIPVALHPHQNLILDSLGHSREGLVVFHVSFNFYLPGANDTGRPSCAHFYHLYLFFGEVLVLIFCPLFFDDLLSSNYWA